jgi:hypothetical protein
MAEHEVENGLSESVRKEIFLALVEAQDQAMSVSQSRKLVTGRFSISDEQIKQIEREGMEQQWPPL